MTALFGFGQIDDLPFEAMRMFEEGNASGRNVAFGAQGQAGKRHRHAGAEMSRDQDGQSLLAKPGDDKNWAAIEGKNPIW